MKKEARIQAEKMFLNAAGNITNREIAKAVSVNPLTVGRWKRDEKWDQKLKELQKTQAKEIAGGGIVRKKAARDEAFRIYMEAGGNVTNKQLAAQVDVSPATISKWKEQDDWIEQIKIQPVEPLLQEPAREEPELDLGDLAAPEQIIALNQKMADLLTRDYLSAEEIAQLADAKCDLLEALEIYLGIVREVGTLKLGE
ncbi:MAG: phage terminase small subunit-related protein [Thermodesulfobacteriota bacterium]